MSRDLLQTLVATGAVVAMVLAACGEPDDDHGHDHDHDDGAPMLFEPREGDDEIGWSVATEGAYATHSALLDANTAVFADTAGRVVAVDSEGDVQWEFDTENPIVAAPVVADEAVFVGDLGGTVYSIDSDGEQIWSEPVADRIEHPLAADDEGGLWIGGRDGVLRRHARSDGAEELTVELPGATTTPPSVRIDEEGVRRIFVGTTGGRVHCIDPLVPEDFTSASTPGDPNGEIAMGIDGKPVFGTADGELVALDGCEVDWTVDVTWAPMGAVSVGSDGELYFGAEDHTVYARSSDGEERWSQDIGTHTPIADSPTIAEGGRLVVGGFGLVGFDPEDGAREIHTRLDFWNNPIPLGEYAVAGTGRGPLAAFPHEFSVSTQALWPVARADLARTGRVELD